MAKSHRKPGSSGPTVTGSKKRGRNPQTGQFLTTTAKRSRGSTTVKEGRSPKSVSRQAVRIERIAAKTEKGGGRVESVMRGAADQGLTRAKDARIAGRVSSELIAKAKARTGLHSDTELVEFALANLALEDRFAEAFHEVKGSVDPDLELQF